MKTYDELITLNSFEERLRYLMTSSSVGESTFGFNRYLNQSLYNSGEWKRVRNEVIIRDKGCDLGVEGYEINNHIGCDLGVKDYEINNHILIHHINPITEKDILERSPCIFDLNNLICTCKKTHDLIHFSNDKNVTLYLQSFHQRTKGDTKLW